ncbi:MAG: ankyrin repeat domain-containing protein, partial [Candidatus Binatia bacterium]
TLAAWFNEVGTVKLLLENGASVDATDGDGRTALHVAAEGGYCDVVALLVEHGASVDALFCGCTPSLLAAKRLQWDDMARPWILRYLLTPRVGANPAAQDCYGRGVLHWCAVNGEARALSKLIIRARTPLDAQDHCGQTALHLAVAACREDMVRGLLRANADSAVRSHDGTTVAHIAAYTGRLNILSRLQDARAGMKQQNDSHLPSADAPGVQLNAKDADGYTALTIAVLTGNLHVAQFLRRLPGGDEGDVEFHSSVTYEIVTRHPPRLQLPSEDETFDHASCLTADGQPRKPVFSDDVREWLRHQRFLVENGRSEVQSS